MGCLLGAAGRPPREPWKGASRAPLAVRKARSGNVPRAPWGFTAPAGGRQQTASPRETLTRCVHVTGRHPSGKNQKRRQTKNTNKPKKKRSILRSDKSVKSCNQDFFVQDGGGAGSGREITLGVHPAPPVPVSSKPRGNLAGESPPKAQRPAKGPGLAPKAQRMRQR